MQPRRWRRDAHQEVKNAKGESFELHVHPVRPDAAHGSTDAAPAEYLAACPFINADDATVKELARKAVGDEKDPWKKALRLEKWVKQNMHVDQSATTMVPAAQTARDLCGDCRNHALLLAAPVSSAGHSVAHRGRPPLRR